MKSVIMRIFWNHLVTIGAFLPGDNCFAHAPTLLNWPFFSAIWLILLIATIGTLITWHRQQRKLKHLEVINNTLQQEVNDLKLAEKDYQNFFNLSQEMLCIASYDGYFQRLNPAWEKNLGYSREELLAQPFIEFVHPDDKAFTVVSAEALTRGENTVGFENRYRCKDGSYKWLLWNATPDEIQNKIYAVASDITEDKKAEEERARLIAILEASTDYIGMTDVEGSVLWNNDKMRQIIGFDLTTDLSEIKIPHYHPEWALNMVLNVGLPAAIRDGVWVGETALLQKDGQEIPVSQLIIAHKNRIGNIEYLSTIMRDMTQTKKIEDDLKRAKDNLETLVEERTISLKNAIAELNEVIRQFQKEIAERERTEAELDRIFNLSIDMLCICGADGYFKRVNPVVQEIFGYNEEEFLAIPWLESLHPDDKQSTINMVQKTMESGENISAHENRLQCKDGSYKWISWSAVPVAEEGLLYAVGRDITNAKQAEVALRESEARYHSLTQAAPVGIFYTDASGNCLYVNDRWCQIAGLKKEQAYGKGWLDAIHPEDQTRVFQEWDDAGKNQLAFQSEYRFQNAQNGQIKWVFSQAVSEREDNGEVKSYVGTITDITERKQAEEEIKNLNENLENRVAERTTELEISNKKLQEEISQRQKMEDTLLEVTQFQWAILDGANYTIISTDPFGIIQTFNTAAEQLLGYSATEVLGKVTPAIIHDPEEVKERAQVLSQELGEEIEPGFEVFVAKARQGIADTNEWTYIRKDGSRFPVELSITALVDVEGNLTGFLGIGSDITERKQAEAALQATKDQLQAVLDAVPGLVSWIACPDGDVSQMKYIGVNKHLAKTFHLSPDIFVDKPIGFIKDKHDFVPLMQQLFRCSDSQISQEINTEVNGEFHTYLIIAQKYNQDRAAVSVGIDITNLKKAEKALQESETRYRQIVELAEEGIWVMNGEALTTYVNHAMGRMLGYTEEEMLGHPIFDFMDEEEILLAANNVEKRKNGIAEKHEFRLKNKTGKDVWTYMSTSPVLDENGNMLWSCALVYDITERKEAEQQMMQLTDDLKRSNKELEQFAYVASHDLQEPLRAITSYTQLLAQRYQGNLDAKADKYINYIVDGATRMQQLINDLLSYSRVGTKGKEFKLTDCNGVFQQTLMNLQITIAEKQAIITSDPLPTLMADEGQLVQLLQNLIGNAMKFCRNDLPRVHISAVQQDQEWLFSVRDNGIGIGQEYLDRIFIIFQRLHTRREYEGTGIGLAICKRIAERHGGRIWVESEQGQGSTFYFTISSPSSSLSNLS